jgi:hypothetical protein
VSAPISFGQAKAGTAWGIVGGWRVNTPGDLPDQSIFLDLSTNYAPLTGWMVESSGGSQYHSTLYRQMDGAWTAGGAAGWLVRWPIRRVFLVAGAGVGARYMAVPLTGMAGTGGVASTTDLAVPQDAFLDADRISTWQFHLDLVGGAQWSFSVGSGIGLDVGWEILRSDPAWKVRTKRGDFDVGASGLEPGRIHFALQWVGG